MSESHADVADDDRLVTEQAVSVTACHDILYPQHFSCIGNGGSCKVNGLVGVIAVLLHELRLVTQCSPVGSCGYFIFKDKSAFVHKNTSQVLTNDGKYGKIISIIIS